MKWTILTLLLILPCTSYGEEVSPIAQELVTQVEKLSNEFDQTLLSLRNDYKRLGTRVAEYSVTLSELSHIKENVDSKYKTILEVHADIKKLNEEISNFGKTQAVLDEKISQLRLQLNSTDNKILNSQTIVTWVTLIVSILIIIIGLFFSKLFLDLYSTVQVFRSHLPEDKRKKIEGTIEN